MYKVVIIEDDPLSMETLKDIIQDKVKDFEVVSTYASVKEALKDFPTEKVDLILLDMELGDGKGFDILSQLTHINFEVIITTMHDSYMLEAIKHSALDYLLKPVGAKDLASALDRFRQKIRKQEELRLSTVNSKSNRLAVPHQHGLTLLEIKDIIRLESDGAYSRFFMLDGSSHLVSKNLGHYEDHLIYHDFLRVHHKHLVNLSHVKNYIRGEGGVVVMSDDTHVDVSRRKKDEFLRKLGI
jgi:two-component system LytT family response regulator